MTATRAELATLYVGVFGRAADADGLAYWEQQANDNEWDNVEAGTQMYNGYSDDPANDPSALTDVEFIEWAYDNSFGHGPDTAGAVYWADQLAAGFERAEFVVFLQSGATDTTNPDKTTLENRGEVSLAFADAGLNDKTDAEITDSVTDSASTVAAAKTQIAAWETSVGDYTMLTTDDDWTGTDGNDKVIGQVGVTTSTYAGADKLDALGGDDSLQLTITTNAATAVGPATISNMETLDIVDNGTTAGNNTTFNLTRYDSNVENIIVSGSNAGIVAFGTGVAGGNFDNVVDDITLAKSSASRTVVNYEAGTVASTTDVSSVTLETGAAQRLDTTGIEGYSVHTTGTGNQSLRITDGFTGSVTVDGDANLALRIGGTAVVVDASDATGNITLQAASFNGAANTTYLGGSGVDTLTSNGVNSDVTGAAGADIITVGTADTVLHYANMGDTGITIGTADTVNAFISGADKIDFDTLAAGNGNTFDTGIAVGVATFADAQNAADVAMHNGAVYSIQLNNANANAYLFVDGNGDGAADQVIEFVAGTVGTVIASDIIA